MRGRGIDFEHRFKTSRWAEDLLIRALGEKHSLLTTRFGLSEVRSQEELNNLEYGDSAYKEPDLLVYQLTALSSEERKILRITDLVKEPRDRFQPGGTLRFAIDKALAALEVEFSPYRAAEMKDRHWTQRTPEEWKRRPLKHAKPPVAPNIFVKVEDLEKLLAWEQGFGVPIVVTHLFDQEGFAICLKAIADFDRAYEARPADQKMLQMTRGIFKVIQTYGRIDAQGAGEQKPVFRVAPSAAVKAGDISDVKVSTQLGVSSSKKYVSHTLFSEGRLEVTAEFVILLKSRCGSRDQGGRSAR
jgi:hypothetical protein